MSEKLQSELGLKRHPSRHTYTKHDEIKHAFNLNSRKEELRNKKTAALEEAKLLFDGSNKSSQLLEDLGNNDATITELIKQVEKLENENERLPNSGNARLSNQNVILLEIFARWQHNLKKMDVY